MKGGAGSGRQVKGSRSIAGTEQASSSGGTSSHTRVDPAEVETKEMDTEEHARAKRDHGCEHLEDGVKRARRMEHQADDDGDVLMELACTDDFEEHCELTTESEQEQKKKTWRTKSAGQTRVMNLSSGMTGLGGRWTQ